MNNSGDYDECTILYTSVSSTMPVFSSITEPSVNNSSNYDDFSSAFLGVKGGSNEFFTYLTLFRGVISFTYKKILLGEIIVNVEIVKPFKKYLF